MSMQIFSTTTESLDLAPFLTGVFYYKGHGFPAVRVTPENIGLLCMEFDAELQKFENGNPYFAFNAYREKEIEPKHRRLIVTLADWIFPREYELHVWPNPIFEATFRVSPGGEFLMTKVEREMKEYAMADAKATAEQFATNQAWEESELHETLAGDHARALQQMADDKARQTGEMTPEEWHGKLEIKQPKAQFQVGDRVRWTQHNDMRAEGVVEQVISTSNPRSWYIYDVNVDNVLWQIDECDLRLASEVGDLIAKSSVGSAAEPTPEEMAALHDKLTAEHDPIYNFNVDDEVLIGGTQDRGVVTAVDVTEGVEDGRPLIQVQMHHNAVTYLFEPEALHKLESGAKFQIGEMVLYRSGDLTETVRVEGIEPQVDGTNRYRVRWSNDAKSSEPENMLLKLV